MLGTIVTVEVAVAEYTSRWMARHGKPPTEAEFTAATQRFAARYALTQGVAIADLLAFLSDEGLPEVQVPAPTPIYLPEACDLLRGLYVEEHGLPMSPAKMTLALQNYQASSGTPIDKADFMYWAKWYVKRFP